MPETPYFFFVVQARPQPWPYYAEIPYAAWPSKFLEYHSNGNSRQPYDREWSYANVMNWATYENVMVWDAGSFAEQRAEQVERIHRKLTLWWGQDDFLTPAPMLRLAWHLLVTLPPERCRPGYAVIASLRCEQPESAAAAARLFARRLKGAAVWDAQTRRVLTLGQLEHVHLNGFPVRASDSLADEVQRAFTAGAAWHRRHPRQPISRWKSPADVHAALDGTAPEPAPAMDGAAAQSSPSISSGRPSSSSDSR